DVAAPLMEALVAARSGALPAGARGAYHGQAAHVAYDGERGGGEEIRLVSEAVLDHHVPRTAEGVVPAGGLLLAPRALVGAPPGLVGAAAGPRVPPHRLPPVPRAEVERMLIRFRARQEVVPVPGPREPEVLDGAHELVDDELEHELLE